jgi:hypothetical protein
MVLASSTVEATLVWHPNLGLRQHTVTNSASRSPVIAGFCPHVVEMA